MSEFLKNLFGGAKEARQPDTRTKVGPPKNPEYFILHLKKGKELPYRVTNWSSYQDFDKDLDERLRKLRYDRYLKRFPKRSIYLSPRNGDPRRLYDDTLDPDHVHKFGVYRKFLKMENLGTVVDVYSGTTPDYKSVPWEWAGPLRKFASNECQLFPYEFRLRDGTVMYKRHIINFMTGGGISVFNEAQSGFKAIQRSDGTNGWSNTPDGGMPPFREKCWNGELVVRRSVVRKRHLVFRACSLWYIVSDALRQELKDHLSKLEEFHPVHVDEES